MKMKIPIKKTREKTRDTNIEKCYFELYSEILELHQKMAKLEVKIIMANRNKRLDVSSESESEASNYYSDSDSDSEFDTDSDSEFDTDIDSGNYSDSE